MIIDELNAKLKDAMKSRDQARLSVLRMLKAKILEVNARGQVSDDEAQKLFKKYAKSLKEALAQQQEFNRADEATKTEQELAIVSEFLPPEMSDDDLKSIVKDAISKTGASSVSDLGQIMKTVMGENLGLDGQRVRQSAQEFLGIK